ncbi:hypothetical protein FOMG_01024 [Fusarium oxysporum f. sp. melonis 26406]|uniref:Uncharacterized protein n=1 Tax=Fusarium oxysporum f. sp. melonis 26406 TaxID=1089452 RepID=X0AVI1_FUSOX|nr:hypothetical protein FOMG_01024 [Fusarium oxysporum f. sp. melonis 26406]
MRVTVCLLDTWRRVTPTVGGVINDNVGVEASILQARSKSSSKLKVICKAARHLLRMWAWRFRPRNWRFVHRIVTGNVFNPMNRDVPACFFRKASGDI